MVTFDLLSGQHDPVTLTDWPTSPRSSLASEPPRVFLGTAALSVGSRGSLETHIPLSPRHGDVRGPDVPKPGSSISSQADAASQHPRETVQENQLEPNYFIGQVSEKINDLILASTMCRNWNGFASISGMTPAGRGAVSGGGVACD